jgi:hypothetical protein
MFVESMETNSKTSLYKDTDSFIEIETTKQRKRKFQKLKIYSLIDCRRLLVY